MDIKTDAHKTKLRQRPLIFLDLETTGLEIQKQEIIEIGAIKTQPEKPFEMIGQLALKIKPTHLETADKAAIKIVGFSEEAWKEAISLKEALEKLDKFTGDGVLIGFNVSFDWAMLDKAYYNLGRQDPFYYHRIDVMSMAYYKLFNNPEITRFSLGQMCKFYQIDRNESHRALDDAMATYLVFKKLMD